MNEALHALEEQKSADRSLGHSTIEDRNSTQNQFTTTLAKLPFAGALVAAFD